MKRILITSTDVMMYLFLFPHVKHLIDNNYHVDIACSSPMGFKKEGYEERLRKDLPSGSKYFYLSAERSPLSLKSNHKAYKELRKIIVSGTYDLVWTNEPVISVLTRLAASKYRKDGLKVLYLAHGFHFFKGTPLKNWLYYPIEKFMSRYCDIMVMINWEDFYLTKKHFRKPVMHINGIGLDIRKLKEVSIDYNLKRNELGVGVNDIVVLSVGELMSHKNHESIIKAIAGLNDPNIKYIICGMGERLKYLKKLSKKLKIENSVQFLGYRNDIGEILMASDIFAHPSKREGLGIASLEAMTVGLPIVTSNVHGLKDYSVNGKTGYCLDPNDISGFEEAIKKLVENADLRISIGTYNKKVVEKFSVEKSTSDMEIIIKKMLD
jgi:glycosyltransferase involved in cell wall biosynthesis